MLRIATVCWFVLALCCLPGIVWPQHARDTMAGQHRAPPPEMRVDVNHASIEQLLQVPGMTRTWAERIVRFRPYHSKTDLLDQGVLSGAVYHRIKDYIIAHRDKKE